MSSQQQIFEIAAKIKSCTKFCGRTRVVSIDGPAGSGKSTLAQYLSFELENCQIVHMDDLYDGWKQDLLSEFPIRIDSWILTPLQFKLTGHYLKYNWHHKKFDQIVSVSPNPFLILEGVGSGHPLLSTKISLKIWIEANPNLLLKRLVDRDGELMRDDLVKWQKHEANYFNQAKVREKSDLIVSGD